MKNVLSFLLLFSCSFLGYSQSIVLNGHFQGKNIYIQNPYTDSGKDFCSQKVLVNGKEIVFENADAYEIKIDSMGLKIGDTVRIEIFHKPDCLPKVLTYNSAPRSTFEIISISVDSNAVLHWITRGEIGSLPFIIEQYQWNKWMKIGEVIGKRNFDGNKYSFKTIPHSGNNKFRVKQTDASGPKLSGAADFNSTAKVPKLISYHLNQKGFLEFDKETMYEVYDQNGNILLKGIGKIMDCSKLLKGHYYLNYDNSQTEFSKIY